MARSQHGSRLHRERWSAQIPPRDCLAPATSGTSSGSLPSTKRSDELAESAVSHRGLRKLSADGSRPETPC